MAAAVHEQVHVAVAIAVHDHGLAADPAEHVIAVFRNLGIVADEHPTAMKDLLHLELEDGGAGVHV